MTDAYLQRLRSGGDRAESTTEQLRRRPPMLKQTVEDLRGQLQERTDELAPPGQPTRS